MWAPSCWYAGVFHLGARSGAIRHVAQRPAHVARYVPLGCLGGLRIQTGLNSWLWA